MGVEQRGARPDGATFLEVVARPRRSAVGHSVAIALGLAVMLVASAAARPGVPANRPALSIGAGTGTAENLKASAADVLAAALVKGGSGITFEIVQRSTIEARVGGPRIAVPDPTDASKTIAQADEYFLSALTQRGIAVADGFYAELRAGPRPDEEADWGGEIRLQALARDGKVYRNEGRGWYETESPPGIGIAPGSVSLLPDFIAKATGAEDAGVNATDASLRDVTATGSIQDVPGLIAADGEAFSKLAGPAVFSLDPDGRVVGIRLVAINTNLDQFDLVVVTDIAISYAVTGPLPEALPALGDTKGAGQP